MNSIISALERVGEFRVHPLGFFYLLETKGRDVTQRVHVWPAWSVDRPENDRHQHSFDIDSMVYAGRIRSQIFNFDETNNGAEREFRVSYEDGRSSLLPTGRRGVLESICVFESSAGSRYFLKAGIIHEVTVLERPCVTVLKAQETGIKIYSYGKYIEEPPFERRIVNQKESDEIVRVLESIVSRTGTSFSGS